MFPTLSALIDSEFLYFELVLFFIISLKTEFQQISTLVHPRRQHFSH